LETDASANGEWYVQVGAFGNHDNAHRLAAKIRSAGYRVILVPRQMEDKELMQVRVGGYFTVEESRAVASKLKSDFSVPAAVVNK
jgi:cell division septation protein DedD